jgi:plastocyanin
MRRLLILLAALALTAPPTAFALLGATKLSGTTGPGFTITLKKAGKAVKTLRPGSYTITVSDKTVRLKKGKYTYFCTPHKSFMKGSFTVR